MSIERHYRPIILYLRKFYDCHSTAYWLPIIQLLSKLQITAVRTFTSLKRVNPTGQSEKETSENNFLAARLDYPSFP